MKALLAFVLLGVLLTTGTVAYLLTARAAPVPAEEVAMPAAPAPESGDVAALDRRVEDLETLIMGMRADLQRLSEDRMRTAVVDDEAESAAIEARLVETSSLTATQRQAVVDVIEAERVRREEEREEAQLQREEQRILDRAAKIATDLGLGVSDEKRLGDLMIASTLKRTELFAEIREGGFGADARTMMRESFTALRTEYQTELNSAFGTDLGQQILDMSDMGGRRGWGGGGGGNTVGGGTNTGGRRRGGG